MMLQACRSLLLSDSGTRPERLLKGDSAVRIEKSRGGVSRRAALALFAGSAGAGVGISRLEGATVCGAHPAGQRSAVHNELYAPRFFSDEQMISIDSLCETIIPQDAHSPGARCAHVCEYIDDTIARADQTEKELWVNGLSALDELSQATHGKPFRHCPPDQQRDVVEKFAAHEEHPGSHGEKFFVAAKRATVDGYYTSEIGIHQELEYQGNGVLAEFPGCTHPDHQL
jgi:hypothetical protein